MDLEWEEDEKLEGDWRGDGNDLWSDPSSVNIKMNKRLVYLLTIFALDFVCHGWLDQPVACVFKKAGSLTTKSGTFIKCRIR